MPAALHWQWQPLRKKDSIRLPQQGRFAFVRGALQIVPNMETEQPHIVVLGAGFGGLTFCQTFNHHIARVTLFDRQNHHLFQPLLYQVATAGLSAPEIAQPIRSILSNQPNVTVLLDQVTGFDLTAKMVRLEESTLNYDYLLLALGGCTSYFGHPEWEPFAPGLKSLNDAKGIRSHILLAFEKAESASHSAEHDRLTATTERRPPAPSFISTLAAT
jgi:NADH dehydrogenase